MNLLQYWHADTLNHTVPKIGRKITRCGCNHLLKQSTEVIPQECNEIASSSLQHWTPKIKHFVEKM